MNSFYSLAGPTNYVQKIACIDCMQINFYIELSSV